jgi:hypothetical protein
MIRARSQEAWLAAFALLRWPLIRKGSCLKPVVFHGGRRPMVTAASPLWRRSPFENCPIIFSVYGRHVLRASRTVHPTDRTCFETWQRQTWPIQSPRPLLLKRQIGRIARGQDSKANSARTAKGWHGGSAGAADWAESEAPVVQGTAILLEIPNAPCRLVHLVALLCAR